MTDKMEMIRKLLDEAREQDKKLKEDNEVRQLLQLHLIYNGHSCGNGYYNSASKRRLPMTSQGTQIGHS